MNFLKQKFHKKEWVKKFMGERSGYICSQIFN
jgi:hypothetical protein